jgi:putative membrane protein
MSNENSDEKVTGDFLDEGRGGSFHRLHTWFIGTGHEAGRFNVQPTAESHFSWLRTRMSAERTMMSWIRTSTALIGFGFSIVQILHSMQDVSNERPNLRHPEFVRDMGLMLIAAGVFALVISLWQYRTFCRYLWQKDFQPLAGTAKASIETPSFGIAICLILIGCYAFFVILIRSI